MSKSGATGIIRQWPFGALPNEEVLGARHTEQGANIASTMQDLVKHLDPLRPVTYASPEGDVFRGINAVIEVRGWNYHVGGDIDRYHARASDAAESWHRSMASAVTTRGIYTNDRPHELCCAYDGELAGKSLRRKAEVELFLRRVPGFRADSSGPDLIIAASQRRINWPCINSHFGILDMCGGDFPKDTFYYYKSWWTTNTVLHLLPHWNWPGREGQEILAEAYSNS